MTYRQTKWLIIIIPALTIGVWEYVRHEYLLPYISMELGNWLAPVIVLLVSVLILTKLFKMYEQNQEELHRAKAVQAVLEEREKIARELHDGIAQSLFLLNAQVTVMERTKQAEELPLERWKNSVHRTNDYVRQAIANLRHAADEDQNPWLQGIESFIEELKRESALSFETIWNIPESHLTPKEKVELLAIIREALFNIHKHAKATGVRIQANALPEKQGWYCQIIDNGQGFSKPGVTTGNQYGLNMMRDRASSMSWDLRFERKDGETKVIVVKEAV
ncbi:sensor histidine kinase [Aureibacillus halotolerans]|uniref:histidine kinase n=1 Tax=Aureibacillus halotolerans TaxID=1508390 RepID=A0A4R6TQ36_9BACI|nr:histidine kinase [Aureibacillus halotolerans]TDQ34609.1 two-component system nitrate/nitrite sensor histidine kinase NarQ [Aureibacillus halotolerans]